MSFAAAAALHAAGTWLPIKFCIFFTTMLLHTVCFVYVVFPVIVCCPLDNSQGQQV